MCGIAGFSTIKRDGRLKDAMTLLGIANVVRGSDGWGVFKTTKGGDFERFRQVGPLIMSYRKYTRWIPSEGSFFVHTRAASTGSGGRGETQMCHPFVIGADDGPLIVGAHNGYIDNWKELNPNYLVDSMALLNAIFGGSVASVEGYGAVQFWRTGDRFARVGTLNDGKLSIARLVGPKGPYGMVWSSQENHLVNSMVGSGFGQDDFELVDVEDKQVYFLDDDGEIWIDKDLKLKGREKKIGYYTNSNDKESQPRGCLSGSKRTHYVRLRVAI